MKEAIGRIAQSYLGSIPKDKGCENWYELCDKMTDDILAVVKTERKNELRERLIAYELKRSSCTDKQAETMVDSYLSSIRSVEDIPSLELGQIVYHKDIYDGKEAMEVVEIRKNSVELEGDYSGGTNNVCQKDWLPRKGVLLNQQK